MGVLFGKWDEAKKLILRMRFFSGRAMPTEIFD